MAAHGFPRVDFAHHDLAQSFLELAGRETLRRTAGQHALNGGGRGDALVRIRREPDAKQSAAAGIPTRCVDGVHQPGLLADLLPEHGAVAAAQHRGEQIEDRCVRMRESGNRPSEGAAGELDILEAVLSPRSELERLGRNQHGGEARARRAAEVLLDRGAGRGEIDIAHNDDDQIVRHVTRSVVADEIFPGDGGKHIAVANHGLTIRMFAEGRRKKRVPQTIVRVVLRHRDFTKNNVFLLRRFVGRERGVQHRIREQVDRDRRVLTGQIDVVDRTVKGRVGIDVAAVRLHGRGNFAAGPARRALEQHVFKIVRQPRAKVGVLVNAPGFHPDLHRG